MNHSTPSLPVHHQLPEFIQTHIHQVRDAIQPSHPLLVPFSSCPQSLPASKSFPMSQLVTWGGQSIGVSASAPVLAMNIQDWFPLGWTGFISLQSKGLSRVFSNITVQKHQFYGGHSSLWFNSHIYTWLLETIALTVWTIVDKVLSLFLNILSRLIIGFGLLCFHFHSFLCIFWFLISFHLWFVGYSEVCCLASICLSCFLLVSICVKHLFSSSSHEVAKVLEFQL